MNDSLSYPGLALALSLTGCAGPSHPFGAFASLFPGPRVTKPIPHHKIQAPLVQAEVPPAKISFEPKRQVLHDKTRLRIIIDDPRGIPDTYALALTYNGADVTENFLDGAERRFLRNGTRLEIKVSHLRLLADRLNEINLRYYRKRGVLSAQAEYAPPVCEPFKIENVKSTGRFNPPPSTMAMIYESSKRMGLNPNLTAGLIAQESGFNPRALSWAKALGLTQVTPQADQELEKYHAEWPRSEKIATVSIPRLKALISAGQLDARDDWRLDPKLSVEGGLTYLSILNKYWRQDANYQRVTQTFDLPEEAVTELILASYNSGATRVNQALREFGPFYLESDELSGAQKYTNHITSFCDHFANEGYDDDDAT